jgi:hypothetical protein
MNMSASPEVPRRYRNRHVLVRVPHSVLKNRPLVTEVFPGALRWHPAIKEWFHDAATLLCDCTATATRIPVLGLAFGGCTRRWGGNLCGYK